jgi:signal transduction histidine kinase
MYEDDGNGFDLQEVQKKSKGIGLKNIEHRIKLINGSIHFESKKNKGFLCSIEIPIANI